MAVLKIVEVGDPLLRKVSRPVEEITPRVLTLLDDMVDTMRAADGVGLAAPQVGILRRVVLVMDTNNDKEDRYKAYRRDKDAEAKGGEKLCTYMYEIALGGK